MKNKSIPQLHFFYLTTFYIFLLILAFLRNLKYPKKLVGEMFCSMPQPTAPENMNQQPTVTRNWLKVKQRDGEELG